MNPGNVAAFDDGCLDSKDFVRQGKHSLARGLDVGHLIDCSIDP